MNDDPKLVPFDRGRRRPDPARMREFAATARKLQQEREATAGAVSALLRETPREQWKTLARFESLRNSGAVERLGREASDRLERDPQGALTIAEIATTLAQSIPSEAYPPVVLAQVRAHAWKARAQALCYLGRQDDAMRALDVALEQLTPFGTVTHDLAIMQFQRAIVLQHQRRFDEAQALLAECREIFADHGDSGSCNRARFAEGNLRVRRGDYRGARELLIPLLGQTDVLTEARVHTALAWATTELDLHDEAVEHFAAAADGFRRCGATIELLRVDYGKGHALLRRGDIDVAAMQLHTARERLLAHGMIEEAGLCGLDLIETRLLRDDADEAAKLAARLVQEFTAANLNRRAVAALAYLHDATAATCATPEIVRSVATYVAALRHDPTREFVSVN